MNGQAIRITLERKKFHNGCVENSYLGYFGDKVNLAQKKYHGFISTRVDQKYESPLASVVSSTLLGGPGFISFVKDNFLSDKKLDKYIPALKELLKKPTIQEISNIVDSVFKEDLRLCRSVKLYLCQQYSGIKLMDIGKQFGIGESGVSQAGRRVTAKLKTDIKLKNKISKIEKKLVA